METKTQPKLKKTKKEVGLKHKWTLRELARTLGISVNRVYKEGAMGDYVKISRGLYSKDGVYVHREFLDVARRAVRSILAELAESAVSHYIFVAPHRILRRGQCWNPVLYAIVEELLYEIAEKDGEWFRIEAEAAKAFEKDQSAVAKFFSVCR